MEKGVLIFKELVAAAFSHQRKWKVRLLVVYVHSRLVNMSCGNKQIGPEMNGGYDRGLLTDDISSCILVSCIPIARSQCAKCPNVLYEHTLRSINHSMRSQSLKSTSLKTAKFGKVRANNRIISKATCLSFFPARVVFHAQSQVTGVDICRTPGTKQCSIHRPFGAFQDECIHPTRTARATAETPADCRDPCTISLCSDLCLVGCPVQLATKMDSLRCRHSDIHYPLRRRQWSPHLALL